MKNTLSAKAFFLNTEEQEEKMNNSKKLTTSVSIREYLLVEDVKIMRVCLQSGLHRVEKYFLSSIQSTPKSQLKQDKIDLKTQIMPFIAENAIAHCAVQINPSRNLFLNGFYETGRKFDLLFKNIWLDKKFNAVQEFAFYKNFTQKHNVELLVQDQKIMEENKFDNLDESKQLFIKSLDLLNQKEKQVVVNPLPKFDQLYVSMSTIENTDLVLISAVLSVQKNKSQQYRVVTLNTPKEIQKGMNKLQDLVSEKSDFAVFYVEESIPLQLSNFNYRKKFEHVYVGSHIVDEQIKRFTRFEQLVSIYDSLIMDEKAKKSIDEKIVMDRKNFEALQLIKKVENAETKIFIKIVKLTKTQSGYVVVIQNSNDEKMVLLKRYDSVYNGFELLVKALKGKYENAIFYINQYTPLFSQNKKENGRLTKSYNESGKQVEYLLKNNYIFELDEIDFMSLLDEEQHAKIQEKEQFEEISLLQIHNDEINYSKVAHEIYLNKRNIYIAMFQNHNGIIAFVKLETKLGIVRTTIIENKDVESVLSEIMTSFKNDLASTVYFYDKNGGFFNKNSSNNIMKKIVNLNEFSNVLINIETISQFSTHLNEDEIKLLDPKVLNKEWAKIAPKPIVETNKEVVETKVVPQSKKAKSKNADPLAKEKKALNERINSYGAKKSRHNRIYLLVDDGEASNTCDVKVVSKTLSKNGESWDFKYETSSIVSNEKIIENLDQAFKNPLKVASKNKAVEIGLVFTNSKLQRQVELRLGKINLELSTCKPYVYTIKNFNQLPFEVLNFYLLREKLETDDKNEYLVDESKTDQNTLCVYSDASYFKKRSLKEFGYGIVFKNQQEDKILKSFIGRGYSNYIVSADSAEFNGVVETLKIVRKLKQENKMPADQKIEIRCDCLNVIRFFNNNLDKKKLHRNEMLNEIPDFEVIKIQFLLKQPELKDLVDFRWLKGHTDNIFNSKADELAKRAYFELDELNSMKQLDQQVA